MVTQRGPIGLKGKAPLLEVILVIGGVFLLAGMRWAFPERPLNVAGLHAWLDNGFALGLWGGLVLLGGALGRQVLARFTLPELTSLERWLLALPLGWGILAYGVLVLGLAGWLRPVSLLLWLSLAAVWTWREWSAELGKIPARITAAVSAFRRWGLDGKALAVMGGGMLALALFQALAPPWDYDGLMYHLAAPQRFLAAGRIYFLPDLWQANGPFLLEMLFTLGLALGSDTLAGLLHLTYALILVLATWSLGRRFWSVTHGAVAAALLLGVPMLPLWATWAYTDLAWAVYEFVAVYLLCLWLARPRRELLALVGILAGLALGNKVLALGGTALLGLWIVWQSWRNDRPALLRNAWWFALPALLAGAPWYLKSWLWSGNPIYPFVLTTPGWDTTRQELLLAYLHSFGAGRSVVAYLLLPLNFYLRRQQFGTFSIEIPNPLFFAGLGILFKRDRNRLSIGLALYAGLWFLIWAQGSQQTRFLLPLFPVVALLAADVLISRSGRVSLLWRGLLAGMMMATLAYQLVTLRQNQSWRVVLGQETKNEFLARSNFVFPAQQFIRETLPPEAQVLLLWNGQSYYCGLQCRPDADQTQWTRLFLSYHADPTAIAAELHRQGVTHLFFSAGDLAWLLLYHDPTGQQRAAYQFLQGTFLPQCTREVYRDEVVVIAELTCGLSDHE